MLPCCSFVRVTLCGVVEDSGCAGLPEQPASAAAMNVMHKQVSIRPLTPALSPKRLSVGGEGWGEEVAWLISHLNVSQGSCCATSRHPAPDTAPRCRQNDWL